MAALVPSPTEEGEEEGEETRDRCGAHTQNPSPGRETWVIPGVESMASMTSVLGKLKVNKKPCLRKKKNKKNSGSICGTTTKAGLSVPHVHTCTCTCINHIELETWPPG